MSLDATTRQPVVETERLTLRPVRRSDAGLVGFYAGDERVARMTPSIPHPLPPGAAEALLDRALDPHREEDFWALDATKSGGSEFLGLIALSRMDRNQSEISYWVGPAFWNSGLASDAVSALVHANPMQNAALFGSVFQDNPASAKVLTNCGFDYIGDAEVFCIARGATVPTWTYIKRYAPQAV